MNETFELKNDITEDEIKRLILKLKPQPAESKFSNRTKDCRELNRLKTVFKSALKHKYLTYENRSK
jgi:hypothetical protein